MSYDLNQIDPTFLKKFNALLAACGARGVEMRPYFGLRSPQEQAKLWRQSRTLVQIKEMVQRMESSGAPFLASCIVNAGSQYGKHVTDAPPGLSWHQWGEAIDSVWIVKGEAEWSSLRKVNGLNGYRVYAEEAVKLGLTPGGYFKSFKDWVHVQLREAASPLGALTAAQIDAEMKKRFGP